MKDRLTIVTSTHKVPSDRLEIKGVRKSSQTELLEHVYADLLKYIDTNVKWIICLDFAKQTKECKEYANNIQQMVNKLPNAELVHTPGWRENMTMGKNMVKTPYFLFWEHDWVFNVPVDINEILTEMDNNNNINYVRFNKRSHHKGLDLVCGPVESYGNLKLTPMTKWSNNPHICRTDFWQNTIWPYVSTMEVNNAHLSTEKDIEIFCTKNGQKNCGTYLYGDEKLNPTVLHLDGNKN